MSIQSDLEKVKSYINNPTKGLTHEIFEFVSTLTPMINVDLLIKDRKGRVLLSWRDDICGEGWHIPGGIIRYKESIYDRIKKVAQSELHTEVKFEKCPILINEIIVPNDIRGHFISLLYKCYVPNDYTINNYGIHSNQQGYLKWMEDNPGNIVFGQREIYKDIWNSNF